MQSRSGLSPLVADDLHHACLHQDELEAAVQGRAKHLEHTISSGGQGGQEHVRYLLQNLLNHCLVGHKSPKIKLKVVAVNLGGKRRWCKTVRC